MKGKKYDNEKSRVDLIDPEFILAVGDVLKLGARKYGANNWQSLENGKQRYYAAALRHLLEYQCGKEIDEESGLSPLVHAACNIMFLYYLEARNGDV